MRIHTAAEISKIDHWADSVLGVSVAVLMENAGRAVAEAVIRRFGSKGSGSQSPVWSAGQRSAEAESSREEIEGLAPVDYLAQADRRKFRKTPDHRFVTSQSICSSRRRAKIHVLCGKGNNGGDGFVAARHLHAAGFNLRLISTAPLENLRGAAHQNALAALACGVELVDILDVAPGDVVIDALFGTGLNRPLQASALGWVRQINAARKKGAFVVSVDLPSGLNADLPEAPGECVQADLSVALHALKPALVQYPARGFCGEVEVAGIGLPSLDLFEKSGKQSSLEASKELLAWPKRCLLSSDAVANLLPKRTLDTHKGKSGHLLVVAGSPGKSGAAVLAVKAALRAGAGRVTVVSEAEVVDRVLSAVPEAMGYVLPAWSSEAMLDALQLADAWVAGPGMFRDENTGAALIEVLKKSNTSACLDADALNALAADRKSLAALSTLPIPPLLTPHPKELARLLQRETKEIQSDRFLAASSAAGRFQSVVVLKGAMSVIAEPQGELCVNPTGGPALATAGTGDVLAGICGALLAQGLGTFAAAKLGTWLHGAAGDLAAGGGDRGLLAGDVIDALPAVFAGF